MRADEQQPLPHRLPRSRDLRPRLGIPGRQTVRMAQPDAFAALYLGSSMLLLASLASGVLQYNAQRPEPATPGKQEESTAPDEQEKSAKRGRQRTEALGLISLGAPVVGSVAVMWGTFREAEVPTWHAFGGVGVAVVVVAISTFAALRVEARRRRIAVVLGVSLVTAVVVTAVFLS